MRLLKKRSEGFTLLELIVVITIIGIIGTMVVVKVTGWVGKTKQMKIQTDLKAVVKAAEMYQLEFGVYPESIEDMQADTGPNGEKLTSKLDKVADPWGNPYYYQLGDTGEPMAYCLGLDQTEGGEGDNADFYEPPQTDNSSF